MAKSCVIVPSVINPNTGQKEESSLYKQINDYTFGSYNSSTSIYMATIHNQQFLNREEEIKNRLKYNNQGELELESLLSNWDVSSHLDKSFVDKMLKHFDIDNNIDYNQEDYQRILEKCDRLNNSIYGINHLVYPKVENNRIIIHTEERRTKDSKQDISISVSKENALYNKMKTLLNSWGVSIGALNELEERLYNGTTDFTVNMRTAEGLVELIRIAKGVRGEQALPEEFAHFIVRAMEDNVLMKRTLKLIKDKNLTKGILGDELYRKYSIEYNNDADLIAEEAAGKLFAIHFLQNEGIDSTEAYSTILPRTINAIENYFSKFNDVELENAINEVNENFKQIAMEVSSGEVKLDADNVRLDGTLRQINKQEERIKDLKKLNKDLLANEFKRLQVLRKRGATDVEIRNQQQLIKDLYDSIRNHDTAAAIFEYSENAIDDLRDTLQKLKNLTTAKTGVNTKAAILRKLRESVKSYTRVIRLISETVARDEAFSNPMINAQVKDNINELQQILTECNTQLNLHSKDIFKSFLKEYMGTTVEMNSKTLTVDDVAELKIDDISFTDAWLDAMSESNSPLLRAFAKAYSERHSNARLRATKVYKDIVALTKQLERDGYKNQDFIYERDEKGNQTGWYMSEVNRTKYYKEREEFIKQERTKYGEKLTFEESNKLNKAIRLWEKAHTEMTPEGRIPRKDLYRNEAYFRLTKTQKEYLSKFLTLKQRLDNMLDGNTDVYKTIKIRKDLLERVKDSYSLSTALGAFTDSLKEAFVDSSSDVEAGVIATVRDFEDHELRMLPIFYTSLRKGEKESDVSMDAVSTLTAYAAMAAEFDEMSNIVSMLEVSRDYIRDSDGVLAIRGGKNLEEPIGNGTLNQPLRVKDSKTITKLNNWFESQVYHRYMKDEGTFGNTKISVAKTANAVNAYSALMQMSFNMLSGISNVATGMVQMRIETIAGQFFKWKDVTWADAKFAKELLEYTGDVGSRVKTSWIALMDEEFNVMQESERDLAHKDYDKKWYNKMFSMDATFFMQNMGEFWMQNRTFLSLIHSEKEELTDSNGKKIKICDAYEKVYLNPNNRKDGAKLVLRKGLKYKDGRTIITKEELEERAKKSGMVVTDKALLNDNEMSQYEFTHKISRKSAKINNELHGIYNKEDMNAFQRLAVGRMVMMYRKWIKPSLNRRFKKGYYDYDLESYREGYYTSAWSFLKQLKTDLTKHQLWSGEAWNSLNDVQKSNVWKAIYEVSFYIALLVLTTLLFGDDDDDTEDSWAWDMLEYQMRRLANEVGVLTPTPLMLNEGIKILDSPMAAVSATQKVLDVFDIFWFPNWFDEIERGKYKGMTKAEKSLLVVLPFHNQLYRGFNPSEYVGWFKN